MRRVAIDYDTVITGDARLWGALVGTLIQKGLVVVLTTSHHLASEADEWAYHAGVSQVYVLGEGTQMQDILSADIWMIGRVDRVVGTDQVQFLYHKLTCLSSPEDYH